MKDENVDPEKSCNGSQKYRLVVRNVHAQLVFVTEFDEKRPASRRPQENLDNCILINFIDAVDGLKVYCSDLTDYVYPGDIVWAEEIVSEVGNMYAKNVAFDIDPTSRGFMADGSEDPDYFVGNGVIEHVGGCFAVIKPNETTNPLLQGLLLPLTALTKDSIPIGAQLSDLQLSNVIKPNETVRYKLAKNPLDKSPRDKTRTVSSARRIRNP